MIKDNEWCLKEVAKLLAIVTQESDTGWIHRNYVEEKLMSILNGVGISLHTLLIPVADKYYENRNNLEQDDE